jgi:hypothetical protein
LTKAALGNIIKLRLFQNFSFGTATFKNAVLQGFSLKTARAFGSSLFQNRAPGCAGNVSAQSISFGTGSIDFFVKI